MKIEINNQILWPSSFHLFKYLKMKKNYLKQTTKICVTSFVDDPYPPRFRYLGNFWLCRCSKSSIRHRRSNRCKQNQSRFSQVRKKLSCWSCSEDPENNIFKLLFWWDCSSFGFHWLCVFSAVSWSINSICFMARWGFEPTTMDHGCREPPFIELPWLYQFFRHVIVTWFIHDICSCPLKFYLKSGQNQRIKGILV